MEVILESSRNRKKISIAQTKHVLSCELWRISKEVVEANVVGL